MKISIRELTEVCIGNLDLERQSGIPMEELISKFMADNHGYLEKKIYRAEEELLRDIADQLGDGNSLISCQSSSSSS